MFTHGVQPGNEQWVMNADGTIVGQQSGKLLYRSTVGNVWLLHPTGGISEKWVYDNQTKHITAADSGLCLDANSSPVHEDFCNEFDHANWTICDPQAAIDARAADIVARLSVADKIAALGTNTPSLSSVGLQPYNWWSEATHGLLLVTFTSELPYASNTALPITTSCSFNRSLWAVFCFFRFLL